MSTLQTNDARGDGLMLNPLTNRWIKVGGAKYAELLRKGALPRKTGADGRKSNEHAKELEELPPAPEGMQYVKCPGGYKLRKVGTRFNGESAVRMAAILTLQEQGLPDSDENVAAVMRRIAEASIERATGAAAGAAATPARIVAAPRAPDAPKKAPRSFRVCQTSSAATSEFSHASDEETDSQYSSDEADDEPVCNQPQASSRTHPAGAKQGVRLFGRPAEVRGAPARRDAAAGVQNRAVFRRS